MIRALRAASRRWLSDLGRFVVSPLIFRLAKRPAGEEVPVSVHMLASSKTWHAGVLAAISFEHFTGRRWPLFIHEDGSVDAAARARIEAILPGVTFVPRAVAEGRVAEFLRGYPKCAAHRSKHNLFLKFFDTPAFAPHGRFIVLDSDVIFFRRPEEILRWVDSGSGECHFNEDTKEKYCIPRPQIEAALGMPLWGRFNSGLVLMPRDAVSLDLAERLLAAFETTAHHPQFFEQTLYCLMGSALGRGGPLPRTYNINWGYLRDRGSICRHYVGDFKHDLLYIEGAPALLLALALARIFP